MNKKLLNKLLPLIILLLALAMIIGGVWCLNDYKNKMGGDDTAFVTDTLSTKMTPLSLFSTDKISKISYLNNNETLDFICEGGIWYYEHDRGFPVDSSILNIMASKISAVSSRVQDGVDEAECGFDKPANVITVKTDAGNVTFTFGSVNSYNGYQYMKTSRSDKVYMADSAVADSFDRALLDVVLLDTLPADVYAEDVISIKLCDAEGNISEICETSEEKKSNDSRTVGFLELFEKLEMGPSYLGYAQGGDRKAFGISDGCAYAELKYKISEYTTNGNGEQETTETKKIYTIYFGSLHTEKETVYDEQQQGDVEVDVDYYFYSPDSSFLIYSASAETYESIMALAKEK